MNYYIGSTGNYYYGQRQDIRDKEVPKRPSITHVWNGMEWIVDESLKIQNDRNEIIYKLRESDSNFIRVIEDIIDVLVSEKILNINKLKKEVQDKIKTRKALRDLIIR